MLLSVPNPVGYPHFYHLNNVLYSERVRLDLLAQSEGTPLYVYSRAALRSAWASYSISRSNKSVLVCYAVKANSNLAILKEFARMGSGFDIVSGGELQRILMVGADPKKVIFSGVGKQAWEIKNALEAGIKCFNVESESELRLLSKISSVIGKRAHISLRINPDVDAQTHPYISTGLKENKFGISMERAMEIYSQAIHLPNLEIVGVACHIGSQILDTRPYLDALERLLILVFQLNSSGISIQHLNLGGGLGIRYKDEITPQLSSFVGDIFKSLAKYKMDHLELILEPGRSLVGNAGVLLTTVQFLKYTSERNFAVVDAAMNDFMRPALYQASHNLCSVKIRDGSLDKYDVVGPICESSDWLAKDYVLSIAEGDVLAIESAGAYGMVMASNYNSRPRAAEVIIDGEKYYIVRKREEITQLLSNETTLP